MILTLALAAALAPTGVNAGRLPARSQIERAFAASRACVDDNPQEPRLCQPVTTVVRNEHCLSIAIPHRDRAPYSGAIAGARCSFQYGEYIRSGTATGPGRWTRDHADFFLVGAPCDGEAQEPRLTCYSWTVFQS